MSGGYILTPDGQECTSVVKTQCTGLTGLTTGSWKRGTHVQSNCASIPARTAIAVFSAPGNTYGPPDRHAAIFESCQSDGINVVDQWNGHPTSRRLIRYSGTGVNGGSNYYTIEK